MVLPCQNPDFVFSNNNDKLLIASESTTYPQWDYLPSNYYNPSYWWKPNETDIKNNVNVIYTCVNTSQVFNARTCLIQINYNDPLKFNDVLLFKYIATLTKATFNYSDRSCICDYRITMNYFCQAPLNFGEGIPEIEVQYIVTCNNIEYFNVKTTLNKAFKESVKGSNPNAIVEVTNVILGTQETSDTPILNVSVIYPNKEKQDQHFKIGMIVKNINYPTIMGGALRNEKSEFISFTKKDMTNFNKNSLRGDNNFNSSFPEIETINIGKPNVSNMNFYTTDFLAMDKTGIVE